MVKPLAATLLDIPSSATPVNDPKTERNVFLKLSMITKTDHSPITKASLLIEEVVEQGVKAKVLEVSIWFIWHSKDYGCSTSQKSYIGVSYISIHNFRPMKTTIRDFRSAGKS